VIPELRPRGIGEILDVGVALYRARFKQLVLTTAVVVIPLQVVATLVTLSAEPDHFAVSASGSPTPVYDSGSAALHTAANLVVLLLSLLSRAFVVAATARMIGDAYVGAETQRTKPLDVLGGRIVSVIGVTLLVAGSYFLGFFACFIGVLVPLTIFAVAIPALILEHVPATRALGRSYELTKPRAGHTLGVVILSQLLMLVVQSGLGLLILLVLRSSSVTAIVLVNGLASAVAAVLTTPFLATSTVALYFDLRIRAEGFDVQLLMQRVDARYAGRAATPTPIAR
jgi:hypothetical protein